MSKHKTIFTIQSNYTILKDCKCVADGRPITQKADIEIGTVLESADMAKGSRVLFSNGTAFNINHHHFYAVSDNNIISTVTAY